MLWLLFDINFVWKFMWYGSKEIFYFVRNDYYLFLREKECFLDKKKDIDIEWMCIFMLWEI